MDFFSPNTTGTMLHGDAGRIDAFVDAPPGDVRGIAVVTHPHPLQGGDAGHKIPRALARVFQLYGWLSIRPNFRGVGGSEGTHDAGNGETGDTLAIVEAVRRAHPGKPVALAGFSFGAFVQARVARALIDAGAPPACTVLAGVPFGTVQGERQYDTPAAPDGTLVVHGESDAVVPLASVMAWARPQRLPVVVVPGANHFFTGCLGMFVSVVERHVASLR
ncbi:alpha/beta fold hydrolase [Burkholderia humptydooensis]|uniref:Alpha/beta fold hydrolase n=2 Tax=Burkholderia humptydooensis TaxID=430531 RepID=A0A7U4P4Q8_9BURK|nr:MULTISPECIES: alpha/beta fold hydrolase [Burkholderia]AJY42688.1 thioesterase domain protein [Burkholderia sp. 2002721687]ALX42948.1 GntR family transcriptional regulator [Burkholderia humptydooensis]EIP87455.1 putative hydrolase of the alpha/beta superfamily protein [Burkholderia humptydooensis MSMB43]QPS45169.1 alpha/beta fold hydrolase [Burkholderia humptydooensis]